MLITHIFDKKINIFNVKYIHKIILEYYEIRN